jgi:hypothetical protein
VGERRAAVSEVHTCIYCGAQRLGTKAAIDDDWVPYFHDPGGPDPDREFGPACAGCARRYLRVGEDGEWEVRSGGATGGPCPTRN